MKINNKRRLDLLYNLTVGQTFIWDNDYYMKLEEEELASGDMINSVRLYDGLLDNINPEAEVVIVDGVFSEE